MHQRLESIPKLGTCVTGLLNFSAGFAVATAFNCWSVQVFCSTVLCTWTQYGSNLITTKHWLASLLHLQNDRSITSTRVIWILILLLFWYVLIQYLSTQPIYLQLLRLQCCLALPSVCFLSAFLAASSCLPYLLFYLDRITILTSTFLSWVL